ncbi:hypothetical protein [Pseudodesulfovibrio pelocollis]|uniref:hypothetical protein n=1 Tax=Pseudodesulfovibrio pelocollis TaxID=3051432 RepID=UPI00255AB948|nr:hypothetical protein [Pseudodesulfovibrio sp. SB368]
MTTNGSEKEKRGRTKQMPTAGRRMVSCRVDEATRKCLAELFPTPSGGVSWVADWAANAIHRSLREALTKFTQNEKLALLDMHNGHHLMPRMCGPDHLALMVRDSAPDGLPDKWGYDSEELTLKCERLSSLEAMAVAVWSCAFWTSGHWEKISPEEYTEG